VRAPFFFADQFASMKDAGPAIDAIDAMIERSCLVPCV
jgi:hypothetical protein